MKSIYLIMKGAAFLGEVTTRPFETGSGFTTNFQRAAQFETPIEAFAAKRRHEGAIVVELRLEFIPLTMTIEREVE